MKRTVVIGLDGATFTILDPIMESGLMPFLQRFAARGAKTQLLSPPPFTSPPSWTTLATGRTPGNTGIFDFVRADERNGEVYFTLYNARDIRCETIWSMISRAGMRVTLLNFQMTFPAPFIRGHVVPGLISWRHMKQGIRPARLYEDLKGLPGFNFKELGWDLELEKQILNGVDRQEYETWISFHTQREARWYAIARHLLQSEPSDLTAIVFDGIDKLQHVCWRFLDPSCDIDLDSPWERKIRDLCLDYFRRLDGYLEAIVALAGPDATTFIVSDHGFTATKQVFRVNVWLHEHGYLTWRDSPPAEGGSRERWERRSNSNFALLDWQGTTAYARTSSSNGIYIRRALTPEESGVRADEYKSFRERLMKSLYEVRNPSTGERVIKEILKREQAFPGSQLHQAPDLTLILNDYGFVSIKNILPAVESRAEVSGTHCPEGIFIARGPDIRECLDIRSLDMVDVAPTLLYSLGLPIPEDLEGKVAVELFEPATLAKTPITLCEASKPPEGKPGDTDDEDSSDPAILKRLAELGYIEE